MRVFTIFRALFVRSLFGAHGLIAIWRLYMVIGEIWCWYLSVTLLGLLIETVVTLAVKRGKEWKWYVCYNKAWYLLLFDIILIITIINYMYINLIQ